MRPPGSVQLVLTAEEAAALEALRVATLGSRTLAAQRLGWPLRTFQRRLAALELAPALAKLARRHGWPDRAAAARAERSARATARRLAAAGRPATA